MCFLFPLVFWIYIVDAWIAWTCSSIALLRSDHEVLGFKVSRIYTHMQRQNMMGKCRSRAVGLDPLSQLQLTGKSSVEIMNDIANEELYKS